MAAAAEPRSLLVRGPNWVGDVVMATPGFRALRAAYRDARIVLQLRPGLAPLLSGAPWFDEILPVSSYHRGVRALVREGLGLRRQHFDLGVCLPDSVSSALLLRLAGVRRVVGYGSVPRRMLLDIAVTPPSSAGRRRLVAREQHVLELLSALGVDSCGTHLELFVTEEEEQTAAALLEARGVGPHDALVVLAPGASYGPSKLWPAEHFARVGDALADAGARVVLVGAPAEAPLAAQVAASMRARAVDLTTPLGLGPLKAVIRRARVLVCNDAGARHVAVAFGVPCVVLFGPTSLEKTGWNLERVRALAADVGCRPCYHRVCPVDHRCMRRLDPEVVIEAALPTLETDAKSSFRGDGALRLVGGHERP